MRNRKYMKKGISFLLSAAMAFSGILENAAWIVSAETKTDSGSEKINTSSDSFSNEKVISNLPVLNNVQVRNEENALIIQIFPKIGYTLLRRVCA